MKKIIILFYVFYCIRAVAAQAADGDNAVIVVSSSKIEESSDDAVEKVEVITSEEIQRNGAKTLNEAVQNNAGIIIAGHPTGAISMQGFSGKYVKILIDGIAVSGDLGGATAAYQIPVEDIDHIEIVKGASSALYGSDAMGGVVNIITKKNKTGKKKLTGDLSEEFYSSIRSYTSGKLAYSGEKFSGSLTGSFDWDRGLSERRNTVLLDDVTIYKVPARRLGFVRANADWKLTSGKIGTYALFSDSLQKSNTTDYETMEYHTDRYELGVMGKKNIGDTWVLSGFASGKLYTLDSDFKNVTTNNIRDTDAKFADGETEIRASWDPNLTNSVLMGFNGNFQTINGDSFSGTKKQLLLSSFAQDTLTIGSSGKLLIVPGARLDFAPPLDGGKTLWQATPKLSVKYNPHENTTLRFSYGMGYKVPSLKQKYWIFTHDYSGGGGSFVLYGNPDLNPESSHGFNLGVEQKVGSYVRLSASGYFNFIHNLIANYITGSDPFGHYTRSYRNIDKALTFGGDISAHAKFKRTLLAASYAYTEAKEYSNAHGKYIDSAFRVRHRATTSASYMIPVIETNVSMHLEWNSPELLDYDLDIWSPDFFMAGLTIDKKFWKDKIDIYGRVDNMFNNIHFRKGTSGTNQKEYFGLHNGTVFSTGVKLHF